MGGSGGGSSGKVDYPQYMKDWHGEALDDDGVDVFTTSITEVMETALGSSPWTGQTPYDPDADITAWEAAIAGFDTYISGITVTTDWAALFAQAAASIVVGDRSVADMAAVSGITEANIVADAAALSTNLDNEITTKTLPRFQGGMRNINAVVSSAFVIGNAIIEAFKVDAVAKHESGLRITAASENAKLELAVNQGNMEKDVNVAVANLKKDVSVEGLMVEAASQMVRVFLSIGTWEESYMKTVVDGRRLKVIAKSEEARYDHEIDKADALWDLEVWKYGGNLLASIGSASVQTGPDGPSQMQTAMGGAMAGAATGYMVGGPTGAAAGGFLGFAMGMMA